MRRGLTVLPAGIAVLALLLGIPLVSPAAAAQAGSTNLSLAATLPPPGLDTGVDVTQAQSITIAATGRAGYGFDVSPCGSGITRTTPDGRRYLDAMTCAPKIDPNAVLPNAPIGELIARFGNGPWFAVGFGGTFVASNSGRLFLLYNDAIGTWGDNSDGYSVTISTGTGPICAVVGFEGRPDRLMLTFQSQTVGLASVTLVKAVNASLVVSPFTVGTTARVNATATKIVAGAAQVWLDIADVAGLHTRCDPVIKR